MSSDIINKKQEIIIEKLKARCEVYRIERETLLRVIKELSDMLYDKDVKRIEDDDLGF